MKNSSISGSWCYDSKGQWVYQSGNDPRNPNGYNQYFIRGAEVWAYSYKDAVMKHRRGIK